MERSKLTDSVALANISNQRSVEIFSIGRGTGEGEGGGGREGEKKCACAIVMTSFFRLRSYEISEDDNSENILFLASWSGMP